ncbi:CoA transferase [Rhodococcus opacus]|nr:CoA transferase [Rhodococcus opacus]
MTTGSPPPLADVSAVITGESRVGRLMAEILTGLGVRVLADESQPGSAGPLGSAAPDLVITIGPDVAERRDENSAAAHRGQVHVHVDLEPDDYQIYVNGRRESSGDALTTSHYGAVLGFSDPGDPRPLGLPLSDFATALSAAMGAVAGLITVRKGAPASIVRLNPATALPLLTVDGITQAMADGDVVSRTTRHPHALLFVSRCACGSGMTIQLSSSARFWRNLTEALGRPDLADAPEYRGYHDRVRNYERLLTEIQSELATRTAADWHEILKRADIPHAPYLTPSQTVRHPQFEAIGLIDPVCVPQGTGLLRPLRFGGARVSSGTGVAAR